MHENSISDNPLLSERTPIQFNAIKPEHVQPAIDVLLKQARQRLAEIGAPRSSRTYEDTLLAIDTMTAPLDFAMAIIRHLEGVSTTPELRTAYNAVQKPVSLFYTSIPLDSNLWEAVKAVGNSGESETLAPVHRRYLEKTIRGFRRAGADLDAAGKKKLEELDVALTKVTTKFAENVLDSTNAFELLITDEEKLSGLPESARTAARESARAKGKDGWRLTLQGPSYTAALTYLDDRAIRQELWEASSTRASSGAF